MPRGRRVTRGRPAGAPLDELVEQSERMIREAEAQMRLHIEYLQQRIFWVDDYEERRASPAANKRARQLLDGHLTPKQRRQLADHGWFEVRGSKSGKVYRIHGKKFLANVWDMAGRLKLCAIAGDRAMPLGDHLLLQKIMIETDEQRFLRIANPAPL